MRHARTQAGSGALLAAAWLLTYLLPEAREMGLDLALSFLLALWTTGLLWRAARHSPAIAPLWRLLAAGWAVGWLGNVAWGVYELLTGESLPLFSLVDGFYLARYGLVGAALWRYPALEKRRWRNLALVALAALLLTGLLLFWPVLSATGNHPLLVFLAGALYPTLDVALLGLALLSRTRASGRLRPALTLLALALAVYLAANWHNFSVRMASLETSSSLAAFLWPVSDVLAGLAALYALW